MSERTVPLSYDVVVAMTMVFFKNTVEFLFVDTYHDIDSLRNAFYRSRLTQTNIPVERCMFIKILQVSVPQTKSNIKT